MSCNDPRDPGAMNCSEIIDRMIFYVDNEVEQVDVDQIRSHLQDCVPCLDEYDIERTIKAVVARSCAEHAPDSLRERVVLHLREVQVTMRAQNADG